MIPLCPDEENLVRLVSALAVERNEPWMECRYLAVLDPATTTREEPLVNAA